jgi:hypothetical protein
LKLDISPLKESQLDEADRIFRLAFGTRNLLPDPMKFDGDAARIKTRFLAKNVLAFGATIDGSLIATSFGTIWGKFAWLGPLSVHPDQWNNHIAQHLLETAISGLDKPAQRHQALFTVAESAKHLALYRKFGYFPWFLTMVMEKEINRDLKADYSKFSNYPAKERESLLKDLRSITDSVYDGLDLSEEISAVLDHSLGETVIVRASDKPVGFAVCHYGPGTEATSGKAYVKFAVVQSGENAETYFEHLLDGIEVCARENGQTHVSAGTNSGRRGAYGAMLTRGFRTVQQGVAMHRPDNPAYDRPDVYAVDDWR